MKVYRIYYKDSEGIITQYDKVNYVNSRSKKRKKSGLEERLNKIFKERYSVSLKKK